MNWKVIVGGILVTMLILVSNMNYVATDYQIIPQPSIGYPHATQPATPLKKFSSYEELKSFLNTSLQFGCNQSLWYRFDYGVLAGGVDANSAHDYSTTNVQVEGVDEADIVKTDGEYLYVIAGKSVIIIKAWPAEEAKILSQIVLNGTPTGMFVNQDKLVVFETGAGVYKPCDWYNGLGYYAEARSFIKVYNISDRENPVLKRNISLDGNCLNSRMIGEYVYVLMQRCVYFENDEVILPEIRSGEQQVEVIPASAIYYCNVSDYSYRFTTILAINVQNDEQEPTNLTVLLGAASSMYVSLDNIYLTVSGSYYGDMTEQTSIYRIHLEGCELGCAATGEVPGRVLNQFSMDEYNCCFRIATTTGHIARTLEQATSKNHIYILDLNLTIIGVLNDLAPGEKIYSARFMGDRCYLVTFKKVDPLFVIDLKNPKEPKVLGELKITGYSDYLHPYGENYIIGIGKETVAAEQGDFAWYQGVKISLFDVTDVENPKEVAKYVIGDRGTDSPVSWNHKALLVDSSKNLLVIPVQVAEVNESRYPNGIPPNAYGEYVWQGAYVFSISKFNFFYHLEAGLVLKGKITHIDNNTAGWYSQSPYFVKRSLYIDNVLYTISDKKIKMNSLEDLAEMGELELP